MQIGPTDWHTQFLLVYFAKKNCQSSRSSRNVSLQYSAALCRCPLPCCLAQEVTRLSDWDEILHVPISAPTVRFPKNFEALTGVRHGV